MSNYELRSQPITNVTFSSFVRGEILMDTSLLLIIGNNRVVSDSYRLKLHDDHPMRTTGVL